LSRLAPARRAIRAQPSLRPWVHVPIVHLWRLREGKVLSFQPYIDNPAMQASLRVE
jgi:hypothetical protein